MGDEEWEFSAAESRCTDILGSDELDRKVCDYGRGPRKRDKGYGRWLNKQTYITLQGQRVAGHDAYQAAREEFELLNIASTARAASATVRFAQQHPSQARSWNEERTQKEKLAYWGVPAPACDAYAKQGVTGLYEWQISALETGGSAWKNGGSMLCCAPTSGGKSLIADILAMRMLCTEGRKVIIVVPYVSLALEKAIALRPICQSLDLTVQAFYNNKGGSSLDGVDIAVATIERACGLINRLLGDHLPASASLLTPTPVSLSLLHPACEVLGLLVFDEIHTVKEEGGRGWLVETAVQKILLASGHGHGTGPSNMSPSRDVGDACGPRPIQVLGISATLPNLRSLATWLGGDGGMRPMTATAPSSSSGATLILSHSRPVPLKEYVVVAGTVLDDKAGIVRHLARMAPLHFNQLVSLPLPSLHSTSHTHPSVLQPMPVTPCPPWLTPLGTDAVSGCTPHVLTHPQGHEQGVGKGLGDAHVHVGFPPAWRYRVGEGGGRIGALPPPLSWPSYISVLASFARVHHRSNAAIPLDAASPAPILPYWEYNSLPAPSGFYEIARLVAESVSEGHSVIVFCPWKSHTEEIAKRLVTTLASYAAGTALACDPSTHAHRAAVIAGLALQPSGTDEKLVECVRAGVAYHHAGMTVEERALVETAFRERPMVTSSAAALLPRQRPRAPISVLVATSTLAQGVNLPARRVIFMQTYNAFPTDFIDALKYKQMAGRAGRAGQDDVGESFLIVTRANLQPKRASEHSLAKWTIPTAYTEDNVCRILPLDGTDIPPFVRQARGREKESGKFLIEVPTGEIRYSDLSPIGPYFVDGHTGPRSSSSSDAPGPDLTTLPLAPHVTLAYYQHPDLARALPLVRAYIARRRHALKQDDPLSRRAQTTAGTVAQSAGSGPGMTGLPHPVHVSELDLAYQVMWGPLRPVGSALRDLVVAEDRIAAHSSTSRALPSSHTLSVSLRRMLLDLIVTGLLPTVAAWVSFAPGDTHQAAPSLVRGPYAPWGSESYMLHGPDFAWYDDALCRVICSTLLYRELFEEISVATASTSQDTSVDRLVLLRVLPHVLTALAVLQDENFVFVFKAQETQAAAGPPHSGKVSDAGLVSSRMGMSALEESHVPSRGESTRSTPMQEDGEGEAGGAQVQLLTLRLSPTALGRAAVISSLDPAIAFELLHELVGTRERGIVLADEAHALFLLTTPALLGEAAALREQALSSIWNMCMGPGPGSSASPPRDEEAKASLHRTASLLGITREAFIGAASRGRDRAGGGGVPTVPDPPLAFSSHEGRARRWLIALILRDVIRGDDPPAILSKYNVDPLRPVLSRGALSSLQNQASIHAGQVRQLCSTLGWADLSTLFAQYSPRLEYGITPDLLPLLQLAGGEPPRGTQAMNAHRARLLVAEGIKSIEDLAGRRWSGSAFPGTSATAFAADDQHAMHAQAEAIFSILSGHLQAKRAAAVILARLPGAQDAIPAGTAAVVALGGSRADQVRQGIEQAVADTPAIAGLVREQLAHVHRPTMGSGLGQAFLMRDDNDALESRLRVVAIDLVRTAQSYLRSRARMDAQRAVGTGAELKESESSPGH